MGGDRDKGDFVQSAPKEHFQVQAIVRGQTPKGGVEQSKPRGATRVVDTRVGDSVDLSKYDEIVFCGYGEPTERLDDLLEVAKYIKSKSDIKIRINTNGLADLIWGEKTAPKLKGLIDTVSVSLNATNKEDYFKVVRPKFGIESYDAMLRFTKDCVDYVPNVVMTVVDVVTSPEQQELSRKICESIGATLRIRPFES